MSFFTAQQRQPMTGTPWRLGAIGVAAWRGVPLSVVLERSGITREAVDVMPSGLDPDLVIAGVNYGRVRRPIPVAKALNGGRHWHPAIPRDPGAPAAWQRWEFRWRTPGPGSYTLRARAIDVTGATQPATVPGNTFGYQFDGIAGHPVITA